MIRYFSVAVCAACAFAASAQEESAPEGSETNTVVKASAPEKKAEAKPAALPASAALHDGWRISTRTYKLNHVSAVEVAEKLNEVWGGDFGQSWKVRKMAVAFEESNTLMITAPGQILDACEKTLKQLDVGAKQVYIEARFVELGNTASHKLGIDWTFLGGMTGTVNLGGGIQMTDVGKGVSEYTRTLSGKSDSTTYKVTGGAGSNGNVTYFNGTLNFSQMALTLKALDSTEDVKIFSNPKIIVSSGKKAIVDMTTKFPNVQVAAKKTFNTSGESVDLDMKMAAIPGEDKMLFAKEAFFSWGISLEVVPRISTNGLINVQIVPTISSLDTTQGDGGFLSAANADSDSDTYSAKYPIIEMQRLITEFNMASGTTAVIGGLSRTTEQQVDTGIPVLRSIPWLGPMLFGSKERVKEQKEIIVFVTVGLVDPTEMQNDAGLPKNAVLGRQYTQGQKLEPGDRPARNMEGQDSLDMRPLEEQARDPLRKQEKAGGFSFSDFIPFTKDPDYQGRNKNK